MLHRDPTLPVSRRAALSRIGAGFGSLGLAALLAEEQARGAAPSALPAGTSPLTSPKLPPGSLTAPKAPHFAVKAKHVIQLFMPGGPSQVDTFDYKPAIAKY